MVLSFVVQVDHNYDKIPCSDKHAKKYSNNDYWSLRWSHPPQRKNSTSNINAMY